MKGMTDEVFEKAVALIKSGHTASQAAAVIGCSERTLFVNMRKRGMKVSSIRPVKGNQYINKDGKWRGVYSPEEMAEVIKEYRGFDAAARAMGVSRDSLRCWCHHNGIRVGSLCSPDEVAEARSKAVKAKMRKKITKAKYEKATIKDIIIRNKWDGSLNLCA